MRHPELWRPMAFREHGRENIAEGRQLVKEADASDANRVVSLVHEAGHQVVGIEDAGVGVDGFAAWKTQRKEAGMLAGPGGGRQKASEEGGMGGEREVAR